MFFTDDIHAQFNTFIADKDSWPCNELAHLMLALSTKRAEQSSLISIIFFCHLTAPALDHLGGFDAVQSVCCSPSLERVHSYLQTKSVPKSKSTDPASGKSVALAFSLWNRALFNHLVNQAEIFRIFGCHEGVTIHNFFDLFDCFAGMFLINAVQTLA